MAGSVVFDAIGTRWQIDFLSDESEERKNRAMENIHARIEEFDRNYSRFRDDSLVSLMAKKHGLYTLPRDAEPMFSLYEKLYELTDGALTPLIGQVLVDAGYDADYSLKAKELTRPKSWAEVMDYAYPTLTMKEPALLDFGAAGKGYLIDIIGQVLLDSGISYFVIDAGGDILIKGTDEMNIGLENPHNTAEAIGIAKLRNGSICGSAGNRRAWGEFHHIMNPFTLKPERKIVATWVVAETAMLADALTTCLFFTPEKTLRAYFPFSCLIMYEDGSVTMNPDFPAELFTA